MSSAIIGTKSRRVYDGLEAGLLFRDSLREHLTRYLRIRGIDPSALKETRFPYSSLFVVSFEGSAEQEAELGEWLDSYYDLLTHLTFTLARADYQALRARLGPERFEREAKVTRRGFGRRYECRTTRDTAQGLADHLDAAGADSSAVRLALQATSRRSR